MDDSNPPARRPTDEAAARPAQAVRPARSRPAGTAGRRKAPCAAETHQAYLKALGERVRSARARRGMSRKILARDSGVSERYLAQLESGQGNISIALLRQVAQAMSLPVHDLVRDGEDRSVELALLIQRLERLDPHDLADAHRLLGERFGFEGGAFRRSRIALIGLRGAGKTTLGRGLAERLGLPFVEMAKEIEDVSGMSLDKIFDLSGQAGYRRYERRALERVLDDQGSRVIATGGSIVSETGTYELLLNNCFTVWVRASAEDHMARVVAQGDMRPITGNSEAMEDLRRILAERQTLYAKADLSIDTSGKPVERSLGELMTMLETSGALAIRQ